MKRILTFVMTLALIPILTSSTPATDKDGHKLTKLWQQFADAQKKDLPQDAASCLQAIKAEAKARHLTWDYYDACEKYVNVATSRNWKLRDSLRSAFRAEIEAFGEPVAIYYMRRGESPEVLYKYLTDNEKALRSGKNPEFWERDWKLEGYKFSKALKGLLGSDWDYCLWSLFPQERMEKEYTSYPLKALVEYQAISMKEDRNSLLEDFAARHAGKAAALLAREDLLAEEFAKLSENENSASADFKAMREKCAALENEGKAFSGSEKAIAEGCVMAGELISRLDDTEIQAEIEDSALDLALRNLESVRIKIMKEEAGKDKTVWEYTLANPKKSYYAFDKLRIDLPDLPDGKYTVECTGGKDCEQKVDWNKYTISAATRWNAAGLGVWATDFRSGEPLRSVDIEVRQNDKSVKTFKDIRLDGFTAVPKEVESLLTGRNFKSSYTMVLRSGDRASRELYPGTFNRHDLTDDPLLQHCMILTDRSAFQPDETVSFKAVLYSGKYTLRTSGEGIKVKAVLKNPKGETLEEQTLVTNANGSVAGSFVLRRGERNGRYDIVIEKAGRSIGVKSVLVDDFVLPTFDLVFDKLPRLEMPLDSVEVKGSVKAYSGHSLAGADISWKADHRGEVWASGKIVPDKDRFAFSFPVDSTDNGRWGSSYIVTVKVTDVTGETMEFQKWVNISRHEDPEYDIDYYFKDTEEGIGMVIVAGKKETWAVAELHGTDGTLLESKLLHFSPAGGANATATVQYPYKDSYPETVRLEVLYFQNKEEYSHSVDKARENHTYDMPLSFERFLDTTSPGASYTFTVKTAAGAEVAATVFDKSTERFMSNGWTEVRPYLYPDPPVYFNAEPGVDEGVRRFGVYGSRPMMMSRAVMKSAVLNDSIDMEESMDMAIPESTGAAGDEDGGDVEEIPIREDFATTIAWEPFLKASSDGTVKFTFTNADKLSTFLVQMFSHDKWMRNAAIRREMVVTIPVKISLVEPKFLYAGDKWNVRVALASSLVGDIGGELAVQFLDGADYRTAPVLASDTRKITVPGGSSCSFDIPCTAGRSGNLGVKITFTPERVAEGADGVFVAVPVHPAVQTLTEAHSAVLLAGMDRAALENELRAAFENVDGKDAAMKEISIIDMIREALPERLSAERENAIDLSDALYAESLCDRLGQKVEFDHTAAVEKLLALRGADGGFAWFKGMNSSPMVTAVVLQRLRGLGIIDEPAAVKYLDKQFFGRDLKRWWYCGITMEQYLYIRSLFPKVPFSEKTTPEFRKEARAYLVPTKERGLNGMIFAKTRRLITLDNMATLEGGTALARTMGIKLLAAKRLQKSIAADVESLVQYAVPHRHGGTYYPNAVMPWRGLLESELYAHSTICNLMSRHGHEDIADGIRLWIMLQKETQHWENDPAYIEAIASVMEASQATLDTRVLALDASYTKPFSEIVAGGNGMSIKQISAEKGTTGPLKVGDRIKISWKIGNEENRSFVRITLPHSAGLVPVEQTSGYRWGFYRNVLADRTELWYESYPEEETTVSEEYYVTRSGEFQCPAAVVESLYAPHYRANTEAPKVQEID